MMDLSIICFQKNYDFQLWFSLNVLLSTYVSMHQRNRRKCRNNISCKDLLTLSTVVNEGSFSKIIVLKMIVFKIDRLEKKESYRFLNDSCF